MAIIIKGKRKGQEVEIHQACNDWFMLGDGSVVKPTVLQLDEEEVRELLTQDTGMMSVWYEMTKEFRFKKRQVN